MNVTCTGCPAKYSVPDEKVRGKKVRITCKHCGTNIVVDGTALDTTAGAAAEPAAEAPTAMTSIAASPAAAAPKAAKADVKPAALESSWLVGFIDERQEQHTTSSVVDLYASGKIDDETLIWKDGMPDWLSPFDVPEVAAAMKAKGVSRRAPSFALANESGDDEATTVARSPFDDDAVVSSAAAAPEPVKPAAAIRQSTPEIKPAAAAIRQSAPEIKPAASPLAAARASSPELKSEPQAAKPVAARRAEKRPGADLFGGVANAGSESDMSFDLPGPQEEPAHKMTGARNESSVLFSLDALTKPDPKASQKKSQDKEKEKEASAALFGESSPNSLMNVSGGGIGGFGAMAAPDFTKPVAAVPEPVVTRPSDPVEVPNNAGPAKKKGGAVIPIVIVGVIAAAAAAFVLTKKAPEKPADTASAEKPAATQAAATPPPTAPDTAAAATTAANEAATASAQASAKPSASASAAPAAATPAAAAAAAKPGEKPTAAAAATPAEAKKPEAATPPAAPAGGDFDKSAAIAALGAAAANAASCKKPDGPTGTGKASVTFAPSGRATNSTVTGAFAGTDVGGCVARIFRSAKVPPFAGDPVTVSKSFSIE